MVINVSEALDSDISEVINVERTPGLFVDGLFQKGTPSRFKTLASVQQPTPKQLQVLKEGERSKNPKLFISKKPLQTVNDKDGTIADIVIYKGQRFKIVAVGDWFSYGFDMAFGVRD